MDEGLWCTHIGNVVNHQDVVGLLENGVFAIIPEFLKVLGDERGRSRFGVGGCVVVEALFCVIIKEARRENFRVGKSKDTWPLREVPS